MKNLYLFILLLLLYSCKTNYPASEGSRVSSEADFDWLLGNWERSNEEEGLETFESWRKVDDSEYRSLGFTLRGQDTIWKENVTLKAVATGWEFQVVGKDGPQPTIFRLIQIGEEEFTCENAANEFPKMIRYYREGEQLLAVIADEDTEIPFVFVQRTP